ncbi:MAG: DUF933 domain-containing protein [bacterium]|nr:DUF933 domain-containing protein [bacterium]
MKFSIIGLPKSGKTTIFNALTHSVAEDKFKKENTKIVKVPDLRVEFFAKTFSSKKIVPPEIQVFDFQGFELKGEVRNVDAYVVVLRKFENPLHPFSGPEKPIDQLKAILEEMVITDLSIVENRLNSLKRIPDKKAVDQSEVKVLEHCQTLLTDGKLLRLHIKELPELNYLQGFQLSTLKPSVICINVSDEYIGKYDSPEFKNILDFCREFHFEYLFLPGATEEELADLNEKDAEEYMEAVGIKAPGIKKLIEKSFNALNLITFYTAGEKDAHAWILTQGSTVYEAAGKIHTDIQKGFIKAEVIHYADFLKCKTIAEVRKEGHFKLVGKEYIVEDGDYIVVRFN